MTRNKVTSGKFPAGRGPGRPKGSVNKTTALLKDAILQAADAAGDPNGIVGYLTVQAKENPGPFMSLLGKVMPTQVTGEDGGPQKHEHVVKFSPEARTLLAELTSELGD